MRADGRHAATVVVVDDTDVPAPSDRPAEPGAAADVEQRRPGQPQLDLGVISTGLAAVDQALAPLDTLAHHPVHLHAEVYDRVLDALSTTMEASAAVHESVGRGTPGGD